MRRNTEQSFWKHVDIRTPDECWIWRGVVTKGYGQFRVNVHRWSAHRLAYHFAHGEIPDGKLVCHSCDNPLCVNPAHLWIGTALDNNADRSHKGRTSHNSINYGSKSGRAKLTESDVIRIRQMMSDGMTNKDIAARYPVDVSVISCIRHRKLWKHV